MNEDEIINAAFNQLRQRSGYEWEWKPEGRDLDGMVDLYINNNREQFVIEVKNELREYQLAGIQELKDRHHQLMVVADRIFPALKERLREKNINYLDGAGNVYIHTGTTTVWLDGFKHTGPEKPVTNRAFTKTGLRTVFYLMLNNQAINMPQRQLAAATGVALGNIKNILEGLQQAGFILSINPKKLQIQNKRVLLDRWIAGYGETLKPALHIGNFRLPPGRNLLDDLQMQPGRTIWGGEPAAEQITKYLSPELYTIYTAEKKNTLMLRWKLLPATEGKLRLYEKFWNDEHQDEHPYAPDLLVYADLMLTGDPRCIETAGMIYEKHLKNEFE